MGIRERCTLRLIPSIGFLRGSIRSGLRSGRCQSPPVSPKDSTMSGLQVDCCTGFASSRAIGHAAKARYIHCPRRTRTHLSAGSLQRIPVKLTHSQHVESSCGILHEKVSE